jgi:hypothetical protein
VRVSVNDTSSCSARNTTTRGRSVFIAGREARTLKRPESLNFLSRVCSAFVPGPAWPVSVGQAALLDHCLGAHRQLQTEATLTPASAVAAAASTHTVPGYRGLDDAHQPAGRAARRDLSGKPHVVILPPNLGMA